MPLLTTTTTTARHLYVLLRTLSFAPKTHVQISSGGLRFSVDDSRAMQGLAFLDKTLFTHYHYDQSMLSSSQENAPPNSTPPNQADTAPIFQISMPALLETLQIFGALDTTSALDREDSTIANGALGSAFDTRLLGMPGLCRLVYEAPGHPLQIKLEEGNVATECELTAYEPDTVDDIPFDRSDVMLKIIMRASWLYDAVNELSTLTPERVMIVSSPHASKCFSMTAVGAYGSASVAYEKDAQLLETFQCESTVRHSYKFAHFKQAVRAMGSAAKVSVRVDGQGVMSCQFMIEVDAGSVSFVDFRFVPFVEEDEDTEGTQTSGTDG